MKKVFVARIGSPFKKEHAQKIGEFIDRISDKSTKNILREIRKNKKHTIYSYIEWDDKKASELFRLQQVRNIVNHIEVEIVEVGNGKPIRAFYSISSDEIGEEVKYVDLKEAFDNSDYRKQVIDRAKNELDNWAARYRQYVEFSRIVKEIDTFLHK